MSLLSLVITIAVVGLLVWCLTALVPMPPKFKQAIHVIAVVFVVLYVLQAFGLLSGVAGVQLR